MAESQLGALSDAEPNTVGATLHGLVGYILHLFSIAGVQSYPSPQNRWDADVDIRDHCKHTA